MAVPPVGTPEDRLAQPLQVSSAACNIGLCQCYVLTLVASTPWAGLEVGPSLLLELHLRGVGRAGIRGAALGVG